MIKHQFLEEELQKRFSVLKVKVISLSNTSLVSNVIPFKFKINYNFKASRYIDGCKDGMENFSDNFSYLITDNKKNEYVKKSEISLLNLFPYCSDNDFEVIEDTTEEVFDILYNLFDEYNLKLEKVSLQFGKNPNEEIVLILGDPTDIFSCK